MPLAYLCRVTRRSRRSVLMAVKRLTRAGVLKDIRQATGRGWVYTFLVPAVFSCMKRLKNAVQKGVKKFSTEKGAFPPTPPHRESEKNRLKTRALRSPGHLMLLARRVVQGNPSLPEQARRAILETLGRMVFHEGRFSIFEQTPLAIKTLLSLFERVELTPAPPRRLYGWARWTINRVLAEHANGAGLTAVLNSLGINCTDLISSSCPIEGPLAFNRPSVDAVTQGHGRPRCGEDHLLGRPLPVRLEARKSLERKSMRRGGYGDAYERAC